MSGLLTRAKLNGVREFTVWAQGHADVYVPLKQGITELAARYIEERKQQSAREWVR